MTKMSRKAPQAGGLGATSGRFPQFLPPPTHFGHTQLNRWRGFKDEKAGLPKPSFLKGGEKNVFASTRNILHLNQRNLT